MRQEYCNPLKTYKNAKWFVGEKNPNTQALQKVQTLSKGAWSVTWGPRGGGPGVLVGWSCDTFPFPPARLGWPSPLHPLTQHLSDPGHWLQPTSVHAGAFHNYNWKADLEQLKNGCLGCVCRKGQLLLTKVGTLFVSELESTTDPRRIPIAFTPVAGWADGEEPLDLTVSGKCSLFPTGVVWKNTHLLSSTCTSTMATASSHQLQS